MSSVEGVEAGTAAGVVCAEVAEVAFLFLELVEGSGLGVAASGVGAEARGVGGEGCG